MQELVEGQIVSDRYRVERVLGQGGMATVYEVRHITLNSRHALKLLDIESKSVRKRLLLEGRIQASLAHPNIVAVTDVLDIDGHPGLVMEFVDGPALTDLLEEHPPDPELAEEWFRSILNAVGYAHSRGLVHRDLKPDNIIMARIDDTYLPKVADFGIAKVLGEVAPADRPGTRAGMAMGTPAYMPPEQVNDAAGADQRADVFALGCILYEMMCGQQAFPHENMLSVFTAVLNEDYVAPKSLRPDLDPRLSTAITRAMQPELDKRTQSVSEFLAILDARLIVSETKPKPRPAPRPAKNAVQRGPSMNMLLPAFGLVVVVAVVMLLIVSGIGGAALMALTRGGGSGPVTYETYDVVYPKPTIQEVPAAPRVKQRVEDDLPYKLTVKSWRTQSQTKRSVFTYAPESGQLLFLDLELENLTDHELDIGWAFALYDRSGKEYKPELKCSMSLAGSIEPHIDLDANEKLVGTLCIDAPSDLTGARVKFAPDYGALGIQWIDLD